MSEYPETMTVKHLSEYLHLSPYTIREKARKGIIPAAKTGRQWRFRKPLIDAWLTEGGTLAARTKRQDDSG